METIRCKPAGPGPHTRAAVSKTATAVLIRDLHDGLGPTLAAISLNLEAARNLLRSDPPPADALLADLHAQTQAAIADIRRLVYDLRPPALDELGLISAIREHASQYKANGLDITLHMPDDVPPLPAAVEVAVYRIVQEALTNVVRHAAATTCAVRIAVNGGLDVEITDDGAGLPAGVRPGVGLQSMRERAAELGGSCRVDRGPVRGTRVRAWLPLARG